MTAAVASSAASPSSSISDGTSTTLLSEEMAGKPDLWIKGVKTTMSSLFAQPDQPGYTITNPGGCWALLEQLGSLD